MAVAPDLTGRLEGDVSSQPLTEREPFPHPAVDRPTVLVVTDYDDIHADAVIEALNLEQVPVFRLNTSDFGLKGRVTMEFLADAREDGIHGEIANPVRSVRLAEIRSVWYRRPAPVQLNTAVAPNAQPYAQEQFRLALQYLQGAIRARWINHPLANRWADNKMLQLAAARDVGFAIPDTILTNSPEHLQEFRRAHDGKQIIVKDLDLSIASAKLLLRGIGTQALPSDFVPEAAAVTAAPVVVQPFVPKAFELRCTVIGDEVFAVRIDTPESSLLDWRNALDAGPDGMPRDLNRYSAFDLPLEINRQLLRLCRHFNLRFAAVDLIVTPDNEFVFLELNPNGQWLWLQWEARLPLVEAMVRELSH